MKNLKIRNVTDNSASLYIYGDIVDDGWKWFESDITPQDVCEQLDQLKGKELHIYINSGGGDVFAGTAIHNMIDRHDRKTVGHVDGVAASIASVILMACDEIVIPANAYVMIHRPMCNAFGNIDDLMKSCEVLETIEEGIISTYSRHSDMTKEELADAIRRKLCQRRDCDAAGGSGGLQHRSGISALAEGCCTDKRSTCRSPENGAGDCACT